MKSIASVYVILIVVFTLLLPAGCGSEKEPAGVTAGEDSASAKLLSDGVTVGPPPAVVAAWEYAGEVRVSFAEWLPGDYNSDGIVTGLDVFPLAAHFGETSSLTGGVEASEGNDCIDGNADGTLSGLDLFLVAANFQRAVSGWNVWSAGVSEGPFEALQSAEPLDYIGCRQTGALSIPGGTASDWYIVRAWEETTDTESADSDPATAGQPDTTPPVWTGNAGLKHTQADLRQVTLFWDTAIDADSPPVKYNIWYDTQAPIRFDAGASVLMTVAAVSGAPDHNLSFTVDRLTNGVEYHFAVRAQDSFAFPNQDLNEVTLADTPRDVTPPEPVAWRAPEVFATSVRLNWIESDASDFSHYDLYRAAAADGPYNPVNGDDITQSEYLDEGLTSETDYWYRVGASDVDGNESLSAALMAHPSLPPAAPTGLEAETWSGRVELNWDDNGEPDFEHYIVARKTMPDGEFDELNPSGVEDNTWTDDTAVDQQIYEYALYAVDEHGVRSALSESLEVEAGPSWHTAAIVTTGRSGLWHEAAFDSTGEAGVAYYRADLRTLWFARGIPGDWGTVEFDGAEDVGRYCSLDFRADDTPAIAYHDETDGALKIIWTRGVSREIERIDNLQDAGEQICLRFNDSDTAFITYQNAHTDSLYYAENSGFDWFIRGIDNSESTGFYTTLSFGQTNWPVIAYYDQSNDRPRYGWFDGFNWTLENLEPDVGLGRYTSLATDSNGRIAAAFWHEVQDGLQVTRDKGSTWEREVIDSPGGIKGSLTLDADENEAIVYYNRILDGEDTIGWRVRIARRIDDNWKFWTVDEFLTGEEPGDTSIAFGPNGEALATWYYNPEEDIRGAWLE